MNATILTVNEEMRDLPAKDNFPAKKIIKGTLRDDQGEANWTVFAKVDAAEQTKSELRALIGKPGDFALSPSSKGDYQGRRQLDLKGWPGKPAQGGFGGKGGGFREPSFEHTETGFWAKQRDIRRAVALKEAVASHAQSGAPSDVILDTAAKFLAFLSADSAPAGTPAKAASFDADKAAVAALAMLDPVADRGSDALLDAWKKVPEQVRNAIKSNPKHNAALEKLKSVAANVMPGG